MAVFLRHRRSSVKYHRSEGFALIASLSIMAFLVLIGVALYSLSSVATRSAEMTKARTVAQANARMALMVAIGELQKSAGPDRRVTAPASLLDDSVAVHKRNWTTVWDTSNWDVRDPVQSRDESAFRAALVSQRERDWPVSRNDAVNRLAQTVPAEDPNWIQLVGNGSVERDEDRVFAELIEMETANSQGAFAYWIGDEGVKARFNERVPSNHPVETWAAAGRMGNPGGSGIHKMEGMEGYADFLPGGDSGGDLEKIVNSGMVELSGIDRQVIRRHFHDMTTSHVGLIVDNRWGGIRRDLSTAFELDIEDFGEIEEFNASGESNNTGASYTSFVPADVQTNPLYYSSGTDDALGYLFEVPVNSTDRYRGPTWDLLRNHYRLYKNERNSLGFRGSAPPSSEDAIVAHGIVPFSYTRDPNNPGAPNWSSGGWVAGPHLSGGLAYDVPIVSPYGDAGGAPNQLQPTVQKLTPQVIRMIIVYGLARRDDNYFLTLDPYFIIHNPYNRPLEFYSLAVDMNSLSTVVAFDVEYEDTDGNTQTDTFKIHEGGHLTTLQSFRLEAPSSGSYRLEAGEIRLMSVNPGRHERDDQRVTVRLGELDYNEGAGLYLGGSSGRQLEVAPDGIIECTARLLPTLNQPNSIFIRLLHPERAEGGAFVLDDPSTAHTGGNINHDYEPLTLIHHMRMIPYQQTINESRAANINQIPDPDNGSFYLFAMDMGLKDFGDDIAVMTDFNHRALGTSPRHYDAADVIAPNWEFDLSPSDLFDLQFVDADARSYWGAGKTLSTGGSNRIVLYDLPLVPLSSLGALQHADTSTLNFHPTRAIANSRIQVGQTNQQNIFNRLTQSRTSTTPRYQIDVSWAANEALWDRYFFSGINWGDRSGQIFGTQQEAANAVVDGNLTQALVNPRMVLIDPPKANEADNLLDYQRLARHLGISGAFNVNSTSVDAWKAILATLSGHEISYLSGQALDRDQVDSSRSPLSRFGTPAGWFDDDYAGFRALSDGELEALAEAIVEQVKLRGPFMGLSDFVNRRLVADETGQSGAIQAAIDVSGVNDSVKIGDTSGNRLQQSAPDANDGMARYLTQGDLLTPLAPILAARSDTFTVRVYGESRDANGVVKATAWCEATVQRIPEWVNPTDEPSTVKHADYPSQNPTDEPILRQWQPNPDLPVTNERFGRKFEIVSFRWLAPEEV